jgi:hypothetical protein
MSLKIGLSYKRNPRRRLLAAACATHARVPVILSVAVWLAVLTPLANAKFVTVTNCNDTGAGSLRYAVGPGGADPGDIVDLTALPPMCSSVITLTSGQITAAQSDLTLRGPPDGVIVKYGGAGKGRVFKHTGTGTFRLENLTIAGGYAYSMLGTAYGGCIASSGDVYLLNSKVTECKANATGPFSVVQGGGVIADGKLEMHNASLLNNSVNGYVTKGGGAVAGGGMKIVNSTISANSSNGVIASGGGLFSSIDVVLSYSTVSGNFAAGRCGGLEFGGGSLIIANSTISGNDSSIVAGGVCASDGAITVQNSTIAFNTANFGTSGTDTIAPGMFVESFNSDVVVTLQSSILSNNTYGPILTGNDFSTKISNGHILTASGADNLIRTASSAVPLPGLITACPRLGLLRNNGGTTLTHALHSHSPAIDAGNNTSNLPGTALPAVHDQRQIPYLRISGPPGSLNPRADIGAYELQQDDVLLNDSFDGCS